jgi:ferredoxin
MYVRVDRERCCGAALCTMLVPEVFDQRVRDGLVELLLAEPPDELHEQIRHAADVCPSGAILLSEVAPLGETR